MVEWLHIPRVFPQQEWLELIESNIDNTFPRMGFPESSNPLVCLNPNVVPLFVTPHGCCSDIGNLHAALREFSKAFRE
jgi:hypothetical protein